MTDIDKNHTEPKPNDRDALCVLVMMLTLIIPFILTLRTVKSPRPTVTDLSTNPTPYGYTWSLSLFIVPVLVLTMWHSKRLNLWIKKAAFWITAALLTTIGMALDVFFGRTFFTFDYPGSTLGIHFWGFALSDGFKPTLPIEEFGFYSFGILTVLLVYTWGDEHWFGAYNKDDSPRFDTRTKELFSFHIKSALVGICIFAAGWFYKKHGGHEWHDGFPGYFLFLTVVGIIPSVAFFRAARPYINWRAMSLEILFIVVTSLFWEASLAVPYHWWGFNNREMLGLTINGFSGLPLEEPLLWIGVSWATVIVYETIYTFLCLQQRERIGPVFRPPNNARVP